MAEEIERGINMSEVKGLVVTFNPARGDGTEIMLVGEQKSRFKPVDIINAFQGKEAVELYNKLITKTELMGK